MTDYIIELMKYLAKRSEEIEKEAYDLVKGIPWWKKWNKGINDELIDKRAKDENDIRNNEKNK